MQKALSESHLSLFDEKRALIQAVRDNQVLSKIDVEDSKKIKELIDLSKEYENDPGLMNLAPED